MKSKRRRRREDSGEGSSSKRHRKQTEKECLEKGGRGAGERVDAEREDEEEERGEGGDERTGPRARPYIMALRRVQAELEWQIESRETTPRIIQLSELVLLTQSAER